MLQAENGGSQCCLETFPACRCPASAAVQVSNLPGLLLAVLPNLEPSLEGWQRAGEVKARKYHENQKKNIMVTKDSGT
jgi:hypothetical protein